jgi:hypothetical protein
MSPEDTGDLGRYCTFRGQGEDETCTRLRMRLAEDDASEYETAYQHSQEGRAAA